MDDYLSCVSSYFDDNMQCWGIVAVMKFIRNPFFRLGGDFTLLMWIVASFLDGRTGMGYTMIIGAIVILLIGLNLIDIKKGEDDEI